MLAHSRKIPVALALALFLYPGNAPPPRRDLERDIDTLQRTECEYRGITASFAELTRAYVLKTYEDAQLLRWQAQPSPSAPATETLVAAVFACAGAREAEGEPHALRRAAAPVFGVTWRLSQLGALRVSAHDEYARDALAVFQQTVDDFLARMLLALGPASLRQGPGADQPALWQVETGAVLLEEDRRPGWFYVRVPSSNRTGWIAEEKVRPLAHE